MIISKDFTHRMNCKKQILHFSLLTTSLISNIIYSINVELVPNTGQTSYEYLLITSKPSYTRDRDISDKLKWTRQLDGVQIGNVCSWFNRLAEYWKDSRLKENKSSVHSKREFSDSEDLKCQLFIAHHSPLSTSRTSSWYRKMHYDPKWYIAN